MTLLFPIAAEQMSPRKDSIEAFQQRYGLQCLFLAHDMLLSSLLLLSLCPSVCFAGGCRVYVFQQWYTATMNLLGTWLTERMDQQLHVYQLKILIRITKVGTENSHSLITAVTAHHPRSFALPNRKNTGTSGCRGSSTRP